MSGRIAGKVALVTGAARGQGRSHAVRLAEEGADIIAVDLCAQVESAPYVFPSADDLDETADAVKAAGRRVVALRADVRDYAKLKDAVECGVGELGRLDIVVANAGIISFGRLTDLPETAWQDMFDIQVTGAWHTCKAAIPHIVDGGAGGSIAITSSIFGTRGVPHAGHYAAAKHAMIGLMRTLALELASDSIRVNCLLPTAVNTPMLQNDPTYRLFRPDLDNPQVADAVPAFTELNALPIPWVEPVDVSNALLFLVSDDARFITGASLPVDGGAMLK